MKTIILTKKSPNETNKSTLLQLNDAIRELEKTTNDATRAMNSSTQDENEISKLNTTCENLSNHIKDLKKALPKVKFDRKTGEFFIAEDDEGKETFRFLANMKFAALVEIAASSIDEAKDEIEDMILAGEIDMNPDGYDNPDIDIVSVS